MNALEKEEAVLDWGNPRGIYHISEGLQSVTYCFTSSGDLFSPLLRG